MAASKSPRVNGYSCKFVVAVNREHLCKLCQCVARDLSIAVCCGQHYCQVCISPFQEGSKPCPGCGQEGFTVVPHVRYRQSILSLEVCCSMKDRGCEWTGVLQDLDTHLDVDTGDCQFVDVQCPNKCSQPVPKCGVPDHLENSCPKRDYNCRYCGFTGSYEVVCNEHYPQCDSYPIPCPNSCTVVSVEQGTLDLHLKMCPYQEVECEVMGCGERLTREDLDTHMERSTQKHITLMAAAMARLGQEFATKLQQKEREMRLLLQEKDREIEALRQELKESKRELTEHIEQLQQSTVQLDSQVHELTESHQTERQKMGRHLQMLNGSAPHHFTVRDWNQRRLKDIVWYSHPIYVCKNGPKISLTVRPNGSIATTARGTHVSIVLAAVEGEYDHQVQWPVRCSVSVQILNQHRDQDHYTVQQGFQWDRPAGLVGVDHFGNPDKYKFISHKDLEWNPHKQTRFLKNDSLLLVVTRIEPHSDIFAATCT